MRDATDSQAAAGSRTARFVLPLVNLADRHPGLSPGVAASYVEAARVCLDRHHLPPAEFTLRGESYSVGATADWRPATARLRAAWANENDATEAGACACVIAAVELAEGLYAIHRAEMRTGADYYVAAAGSDINDLERSLRLEVSGTDASRPAAVERLLVQKVEQAARGKSNLPAMAGVVGFQARLILLKHVHDE